MTWSWYSYSWWPYFFFQNASCWNDSLFTPWISVKTSKRAYKGYFVVLFLLLLLLLILFLVSLLFIWISLNTLHSLLWQFDISIWETLLWCYTCWIYPFYSSSMSMYLWFCVQKLFIVVKFLCRFLIAAPCTHYYGHKVESSLLLQMFVCIYEKTIITPPFE